MNDKPINQLNFNSIIDGANSFIYWKRLGFVFNEWFACISNIDLMHSIDCINEMWVMACAPWLNAKQIMNVVWFIH